MSKISNYDDLLLEKQRLEADLIHTKAAIRHDLLELRDEFKPAISLLSFVGKLTKPTRMNPIASVGLSLAAELLLKNTLLARAGMVGRAVLPALVKKAASFFMSKNGGGIVQRVVSSFKKSRSNGHQF